MSARNWAGNVVFGATKVHRPTSVEQLQDLVAGSRRIRALGSGHSFSRVADSDAELVRLDALPPRVDVAPDGSSATVSAGLRYGEVAPVLHAAGRALHNLGSLPHICVAGAVATGTHGSGDGHGCLATAVVGLDLVTATGELLHLDPSDPRFAGSVVSLGALGIVSAVTLAVEPTYDVAQEVYDDLPWPTMLDRLDEVFAAGDSVSVFTTWRTDAADQVWVKRRTDRPWQTPPSDWLGATRATTPRHPVPGLPGDACTAQLGEPGPWHERLPHFRLDHTPSHGDELQTEYLVPREHAVAAVRAVAGLRERVSPLLFVSELRTIAADDRWLSPAYGRDSLGLHFTWRPEPDAVQRVVAAVEEALAPYDARPHWGKVFAAGDLTGRYPRSQDFRALRDELDPDDVFGNAFLDRHLPRAVATRT